MAGPKTSPAMNKEKRTGNRRAYPRIAMNFEVRFAAGQKELAAGEPLEIGEGGLSLRTRNLAPLDSEVNVEFRLGDDPKWVKVRCVVRHSEGDKLGLEFLNLRMNDRLKIVDHLSAKK